jgi:hypothetical protein
MRIITFIFSALFSILLYAQDNLGGMALSNPQSSYVQIIGLSSDRLREVYNNKINEKVDGSPYLYKSWINHSKIYSKDKVYVINSFNYNIFSERFEAKLSEDSVFIIDPSMIKKISINNKIFARYLDPEFQRNSYFEEIIDFKGNRLLKKYTIRKQEGSVNPLTKVKLTNDILIQGEDFYICNTADRELKKIKLKKSSVLSYIDKNYSDKVKEYVKENRLNYKRVADLKVIFQFYNNL